MKKGYYTDLLGNVLGYWESPEIQNIEGQIWIESDAQPPVYIPDNTKILQQIWDLERQVTVRRILEGGQWMEDTKNQIAALRTQIK